MLTLVSGETSAPVPGASVTIEGRSLKSDTQGQVSLDPALGAREAALDVIAAGYLERKTLLRSDRFTLWPRSSPTGLDETYTARIVYNCTGTGCVSGGEPLYRIVAPSVAIVPSPELRADPEALTAHEVAAAMLTAATQGQMTFSVSPTAFGALTVRTFVDPEDPDIVALDAAGVTRRSIGTRSEVTGAVIALRSFALARRVPLILHELGHAFGLGHSPRVGDVMWSGPELYAARDFSARERLAIDLMLQRSPGNRFPDEEATGAASAGSRVSVIACGQR
jgi:hypothetical protein